MDSYVIGFNHQKGYAFVNVFTDTNNLWQRAGLPAKQFKFDTLEEAHAFVKEKTAIGSRKEHDGNIENIL